MKGLKLKKALIVLISAALLTLASCEGKKEEKEKKELFSVDFQENRTLRYAFTSSREIETRWPSGSSEEEEKGNVDKDFESVEITVAYTPIKVDLYGLTTIKATCESIRASRRSGSNETKGDAVVHFGDKSYTFTVNPAGKIVDNSELYELIQQAGKKAFRSSTKRGRIKEPDMIWDYITTQWFLWDSVCSIEKPADGVSIGQSWKSKLSIPTPMVMRQARDVTYTLDEITQSEKGRLAVIKSTFSRASSVPSGWPILYTGKFRMSGRFGFLMRYRIQELTGEGKEIFNIDAGRIEEYNHNYKIKMKASLQMGLSGGPQITIKQRLTMKLLED